MKKMQFIEGDPVMFFVTFKFNSLLASFERFHNQ